MKKVSLKMLALGAVLMVANGYAHAQYVSMKNTLKVEALGGVAVPSNNAAANIGVGVAYQNLVTRHLGVGIATGYSHFIGQKNTVGGVKLDNNDFGVVPVAALVRYYPQSKGVYVGTDLGYGFITGKENVTTSGSYNAEMPTGGFYLKPEIGYHNRHWNFFAHYAKVFTGSDGKVKVGNDSQKFSAGSIGVGVAYNIGLGR
ncbi:MAG: hypothetical protein QM727_00520 [Niabella sp.]